MGRSGDRSAAIEFLLFTDEEERTVLPSEKDDEERNVCNEKALCNAADYGYGVQPGSLQRRQP